VSAVKWRTTYPERYRAIREQVKARARAKWRQLPAEERAGKLATFAADNHRDHAQTLPHAHQTGRRWSAEDDAILVTRAAEADREVAIALERMLWAVRSRRAHLRRRR
jgi:hypothetical protein